MASRKDLKKDIDNKITELITDCYMCIYEHPDMDLSGFETVINQAIDLKRDLITRINCAGQVGGTEKLIYKEIKNDLLGGLSDFYNQLNTLIN